MARVYQNTLNVSGTAGKKQEKPTIIGMPNATTSIVGSVTNAAPSAIIPVQKEQSKYPELSDLAENGIQEDAQSGMGASEADEAPKDQTANTAAKSTGAVSQSSAAGGSASASFDYSPYKESDLVREAYATLNQHIMSKPGAYESKWQAEMDAIMNEYRNREDFSYDINADALYHQYADQYARMGEMAMLDTMGEASTMTGGYVNSYAATAANQAYQQYLAKLNDVIPELSGMAYDRYRQDGEDLLTEYSMLQSRESDDYAKYMDALSRYYSELDYLTGRYDTERDYDYGMYQDGRNFAYDSFQNQQTQDRWQTEFDLENSQSGGATGSGGDYDIDYSDGDIYDLIAGTQTAGISQGIRDKAESFTHNDDLASYLDGLVANGVIAESDADMLFSEYMTPDAVQLKDRDWTLTDDGGVNWLWGIDRNAEVSDNYGNAYRLDKLVDALVADGMSKSDAKDYVMKLQKHLGA